MKKILLAIMALMTFGGSAFAQDKFVVSETTIPQGGSAVMTVQLSNPKNAYGGFQFDIQLPPGFKATAVAPAKRITDMGVDFSLSVSQPNKDKNEYNILGYNTEMTNIVGTEGDLVYVTISADAMVALGEYEATIINQTMSTVDAKESTAPDMTVKLIVNDVWVLDEKSSVAPVTSGKAVKVEVKRTVKAGQWSTIVLPFTMPQTDVKRVFGDAVEIATWDSWFVSDYDDDLNVNAVELKFKTPTAVQLKQGFKAGTIYLVKSVNDVESFTVENVEITSTSVEASQVKETGDWESTGYARGTYVATKVPAQGLFINSNKFWYSTGKTNIKGFRAWFDLGEVVSASYYTGSDAKITITVDGEATSIDGIPSYQHVVEGVYDLSGRKIQLKDGDLNNLQKGVYIIDGKKVTIK